MPACHAGDRGFEPRQLRHSKLISAKVAQSVEQGTENPRVGGSIPSLGTIFFERLRMGSLFSVFYGLLTDSSLAKS